MRTDDYNKTYVAAAAVNSIISAVPCHLHSIIIGADVASSVIEVSDNATDGDGTIVIKLAGSTLMTAVGGTLLVDMKMHTGITCDVVNQTDLTYIWR
jgi:hypothetical protein